MKSAPPENASFSGAMSVRRCRFRCLLAEINTPIPQDRIPAAIPFHNAELLHHPSGPDRCVTALTQSRPGWEAKLR